MANQNIIVHDIFEIFASTTDRGLTYSQLMNQSIPDNNNILELGQGLTEKQIGNIIDRGYILQDIKNITKEEKEYVHKVNENNVIITVPEILEEKKFSSNLMFNHEMDLVADHITGLHIPAVILIESARQKMLSVFNRFFAQKTNPTRFTILSINSKFYGFVFPIGAQLVTEVINIEQKKNFLKATLDIKIMQCGIVRTCVEISFMCCDEDIAIKKEKNSYAQLINLQL